MQLSGLQDNALLQTALTGSNAKSPYYPFRYAPDSDMGSNITAQHTDVADYIGARLKAQIELRNNANRTGMTTANTDIRPTLISEQEMARRGWLVNPTLAQIYSTENVSQEQHDVDSIAFQTGRGPPLRQHRVRTDYGSAGMVVEDV